MDPANEGRYRAPALRCHACTAKAAAAAEFAKDGVEHGGLYYTTTLNREAHDG